MTTKKKNHHFVPQFILRAFSEDGRTVAAFVLDRALRIDRAGIADQCSKDYLYGRDPAVEDSFGQMERAVAGILRSFSEHKQDRYSGPYMIRRFPTIDEAEVLRAHPLSQLREFVFYQCHRTLASKVAMADQIDAAVKHFLRKDQQLLEERPDLLEALDHVRIERSDTMAEVLYGAAPTSYLMLDLAVKFIVTDEPSFIISDHPVVIRNEFAMRFPGGPGALGMPARGLQMFMPVSPRIALAVYDPLVYDYGRDDSFVVRVGAADAAQLNSMQAANAHECIYFDRRTSPDLEALRAAWAARPDARPRIVDGPIIENDDGTLTQQTKFLSSQTDTGADLSFVRINVRTDEDNRLRLGDEPTFSVRSFELMKAVAEFTRWRSPKPVHRDHRNQSIAITETGSSRSVVRPIWP